MGAEQGGKHSPWVTSEGGREGRRQGDPQAQGELAVAPAHLAPGARGWQGAVLGQTCLPGALLWAGRGWARAAQRSSVWLEVEEDGVGCAVLGVGGHGQFPLGASVALRGHLVVREGSACGWLQWEVVTRS